MKNSSLLAQLVERSAFKRICLSKDTEMSGVRAPYEEFFTFLDSAFNAKEKKWK